MKYKPITLVVMDSSMSNGHFYPLPQLEFIAQRSAGVVVYSRIPADGPSIQDVAAVVKRGWISNGQLTVEIDIFESAALEEIVGKALTFSGTGRLLGDKSVEVSSIYFYCFSDTPSFDCADRLGGELLLPDVVVVRG